MSDTLKQAQHQLHELRQQYTEAQPEAIAEIAAALPSNLLVANGHAAIDQPLPPPEPVEVRPGEVVRLDELDTSWHPKVAEAVGMARNWQKERQGGRRNASMVMVARQVTRPEATAALGADATDKQIRQYVLHRTGYGCGKTHIALACLWSECYAADGIPVAPVGKFFLADRLIQLMDASAHPRDEIGDAPIIVIDDVGTEQEIPFIGKERQEAERWARYFKIINYCADTKDGKPGVAVLITGNLTLDELAERIGGRAWSRLLEIAPKGFMQDMTGVEDYRRKAGGR